MRFNKIVLAGGSGYLGTVLAEYYSSRAKEVVILSRRAKDARNNITTVVWDATTPGDWTKHLEGADLLINLCGKNVNCRYNDANKKEIFRSRIVPTTLLGEEITKCQHPPKLWINVVSATIYRHAEDRPQDEETGEIGHGFSIDICKAWEKAFTETFTPRIRKVALRMGIVLGRKDGVFPRLLNLVKLGMGGKQGNGQQLVSWIHEQDVARITEWLVDHEKITGVINCTAPNAIKNTDLMREIRRSYGMSFGLPAPQWLLELGAILIGTETELILKSRWVAPTRLQNAGYKFLYSDARHAIHEILCIRG